MKNDLTDKKTLWLSIIVALIVAFLIILLEYVTNFLDKRVAINFTLTFIFILFVASLIRYKSLTKK